jgi:hypothetical protein
MYAGRDYSINEQVILIISRLGPTYRDSMKRKFTQLVPQNGLDSHIPLECTLTMLILTLT